MPADGIMPRGTSGAALGHFFHARTVVCESGHTGFCGCRRFHLIGQPEVSVFSTKYEAAMCAILLRRVASNLLVSIGKLLWTQGQAAARLARLRRVLPRMLENGC